MLATTVCSNLAQRSKRGAPCRFEHPCNLLRDGTNSTRAMEPKTFERVCSQPCEAVVAKCAACARRLCAVRGIGSGQWNAHTCYSSHTVVLSDGTACVNGIYASVRSHGHHLSSFCSRSLPPTEQLSRCSLPLCPPPSSTLLLLATSAASPLRLASTMRSSSRLLYASLH